MYVSQAVTKDDVVGAIHDEGKGGSTYEKRSRRESVGPKNPRN